MENFIFDENELISLLLPYQKKILLPLIETYGEERAAQIWLSPSNHTHMQSFGGESDQDSTYFNRVIVEIKKLICGDPKYENEYQKILLLTDKSANFIVISIAAFLGDVFGATPALLTPVVILILKSISKVGVNAWCAI